MTVETVSEIKCHNGIQGVYTHRSAALSCDMTFGLFLPQLAQSQKVPLI
ncbi:MAG: S-formylglutathione hydrolase, partial [Rhodobacteraceae bacterium]|nr:S-formylglutathione hydrolase [Paracoccaceae bacterium]